MQLRGCTGIYSRRILILQAVSNCSKIYNYMKTAILQSNFLPWKGYFDIINQVDLFILFDDAQFTKNDWRNRNVIKTNKGLQWLSVPVHHTGRFGQKICETETLCSNWAEKHIKTIQMSYARSPYFDQIFPCFKEWYTQSSKEKLLSRVNYIFIRGICELLGITTSIAWSMDYKLIPGKSERLLDLCMQVGATEYLTGPSASNYLNTDIFRKQGITVHWMSYEGYPEYNQLFPPFYHNVSILDLLMNCGSEQAGSYMLSLKTNVQFA